MPWKTLTIRTRIKYLSKLINKHSVLHLFPHSFALFFISVLFWIKFAYLLASIVRSYCIRCHRCTMLHLIFNWKKLFKRMQNAFVHFLITWLWTKPFMNSYFPRTELSIGKQCRRRKSYNCIFHLRAILFEENAFVKCKTIDKYGFYYTQY